MKIFQEIQRTESYKKITSKYFFTRYPEHARQIAEEINRSYKKATIIIIGGDGTVHEVVNGVTKDSITIAVIPGGSGNDFARGCQIKG